MYAHLYLNKRNWHEMRTILLLYFIVILQQVFLLWLCQVTRHIPLAKRFTARAEGRIWGFSRNLVSFLGLDAGSKNGYNPEGSDTLADGSGMLVPHGHLSLGSMELLLHTINAMTPAERDSLLLEESDFVIRIYRDKQDNDIMSQMLCSSLCRKLLWNTMQ